VDNVDRKLFSEACQGDRTAFWKLVVPYRGLIYSVAYGMLRNPQRAEDQVHDVFLIAFRSLTSLRVPERLPNWLYSMTRNHICDLMRREERFRKAVREITETAEVVHLSQIREKEEWMDLMDAAMRQLPESFRVILGLKYFNDYSCQEIAEILDISVAAVKSRLFEARKLLRKKTETLSKEAKEQNNEMRRI
jgi:RNA polymerase sigma-70 factor (ECF subfamily)